jgi:predicted CoA-binding protein
MDLIKTILITSRTIAVIGMKDNPGEDAFKVPDYMERKGYKIYPVNPTRLGKNFRGEDYVSKVTDLKVPVDIVNIFRRPQYLPGHAEEILQMNPLPKYVWFQLGIRNDQAAEMLEKAGIEVVQNRCIMVEHIRIRN